MKARPILFSGPMVCALLDGTKTQTRRIAKLNEAGRVKLPGSPRNWHLDDPDAVKACPYGQAGDLLWVRETWAPSSKLPISMQGNPRGRWVRYAADGEAKDVARWKPSIHMPRAVSRLTLLITDVRVERLQEISPHDAIAEGIGTDDVDAAVASYAALWERINGPGAWAENPWVWAVSFEVIKTRGAS